MEILHFKDKPLDEKEYCNALADVINNAVLQEKMTEGHRTDKCVATIPAREYFRLVKNYGSDVVLSKEFLQYFNKKHSDLSPNKA